MGSTNGWIYKGKSDNSMDDLRLSLFLGNLRSLRIRCTPKIKNQDNTLLYAAESLESVENQGQVTSFPRKVPGSAQSALATRTNVKMIFGTFRQYIDVGRVSTFPP